MINRGKSEEGHPPKHLNVLVLFPFSEFPYMSPFPFLHRVSHLFSQCPSSCLRAVPGGAGSARGGGEAEVPPGEEAEGVHHRAGGGHQYCGLR